MATITKFVKALLGKEDVNWGDATTTFARETYTGGSLNVHYVDDSVIPASALGGYVDDHLHRQNTDTGTSNTSFTINSGGNSPILSSAGLTADRTFTFPNTGDQALTGTSELASTAASYGASLVGIRDAGGYFAATNVETVTQELGLDVSTLQLSSHNSGMKNGFKLGYSSTVAVTISGGIWAHNGTTNQHVYTATQVTFTFGPSGSNAASSNLGASQMHYVYIDDSAVVSAASRLLTAAQFQNSTTAPAWSHSKVGWYNGNDRCIGAVLTNAASEISSFIIVGKHYFRYASPVLEYTSAACGTTYASLDVASSIPAFSTMVRLRINCATPDTFYVFDTSATATSPEAHSVRTWATLDIPTSPAQAVYWYGSGAVTTEIHTCGYYMDEL